MVNIFAEYMKENGWNVELYEEHGIHLSSAVATRYTNIPKQWLEFIETVKCMRNSEETIWFLCANDYEKQSEEAFQWNEWEKISLESADGDNEWENQIQAFWNNHLPIIMSVRACYSYYAISMEDGSIVKGEEPEFEECEVIATSFFNFIEKIVRGEIKL